MLICDVVQEGIQLASEDTGPKIQEIKQRLDSKHRLNAMRTSKEHQNCRNDQHQTKGASKSLGVSHSVWTELWDAYKQNIKTFFYCSVSQL